MKAHRLKKASFFAGMVLVFASGTPAWSQEPPPQPPGVDVQARGPVHEAFAQPTTAKPEQSPIIPKPPPASIDEVPPEQKPEGDNVQWIPGYWAWEDDISDFIWVSGCWRIPPPGQRWIPGHWQEVDSGWLWISGYWTPDGTAEVQYLPSPPPTLEQGPSTAAPDGNSMYVPGCWVYVTNKYMWRPGHWIPFRLDWMWVPACYIWTPGGYIFVDGYWDHPLDQRGLLFSPIRFDLRLWAGYGRPYVPQFVVQSDFLIGALFVRLANRHFYFGDYFEPLYERRGFVAWVDYHPTPVIYDPSFAYYRHLHGVDPRWEPALRGLYKGRFSGEIPRPPRTLARQFATIKEISVNKTETLAVGKSINLTHLQNATVLTPINKIQTVRVTNLTTLGGGKAVPGREMKIVNATREDHEREIKSATQIRAIGVERRDTEAKILRQGEIPIHHTDPPRPVKFDLPKPPPAVRPVETIKKVPERVMPPMHEERPIPKFEPPRPPAPPKKK